MSLQTESMRVEAEKSYVAGQRENGKWSAVEFVNHPTPSGCERWLPTYEDNREWDTKEQAIEELKKALEPDAKPAGISHS